MALLAFHWSGVYKEKLLSGNKTSTIMLGQQNINVGDEILAFVSEGNAYTEKTAERIGMARITRVRIMRVGDLDESDVAVTGHESVEDLKESLRKWYNTNDDSIITYVEFIIEAV